MTSTEVGITIILWEINAIRGLGMKEKNQIVYGLERLKSKFPNITCLQRQDGLALIIMDNFRVAIYQVDSEYIANINIYNDTGDTQLCSLKSYQGEKERVYCWVERWLKSMSFRFQNNYPKNDNLVELQRIFPALTWQRQDDFRLKGTAKIPKSDGYLCVFFERDETLYHTEIAVYHNADVDQYVQLKVLTGAVDEVLIGIEDLLDSFVFLANSADE